MFRLYNELVQTIESASESNSRIEELQSNESKSSKSSTRSKKSKAKSLNLNNQQNQRSQKNLRNQPNQPSHPNLQNQQNQEQSQQETNQKVPQSSQNDPNHIYNIPPIDPLLSEEKPWKKDPKYFNKCKISSLALMKMSIHAQQGGSIEIMGMLIGKILNNTIVVLDTYRLPVEGTETRVNAQGEAYEYMVQYLELNQKLSGKISEEDKDNKDNEIDNHIRKEHIVGWYHSHPGYGCWLSGIDVSTQELNQNFQDPYLAIVVDPVKTLKSGKVDIGAFRTLPQGYQEHQQQQQQQQQNKSNSTTLQKKSHLMLPKSKRSEFGSHSNRYYSLDIEIFENSKDLKMLNLIKNQNLENRVVSNNNETKFKDTIDCFSNSNFKDINFLNNFELIEEGNNFNEELTMLNKKLTNLKNPVMDYSKNDIFKKLVNFHLNNNTELKNDKKNSKSKSKKLDKRLKAQNQAEGYYDDAVNVSDESDLEHDDIDRGHQSAGMTDGEDNIEEEEEENDSMDDEVIETRNQNHLNDDMETDEEESQNLDQSSRRNFLFEQRHNSRFQRGLESSNHLQFNPYDENITNHSPKRLKRRQESDPRLQHQQQNISRRDQLDDVLNLDHRVYSRQQRSSKSDKNKKNQSWNKNNNLRDIISQQQQQQYQNQRQMGYNYNLGSGSSSNDYNNNYRLLNYGGIELKDKNKELIESNNIILNNSLSNLINLELQSNNQLDVNIDEEVKGDVEIDGDDDEKEEEQEEEDDEDQDDEEKEEQENQKREQMDNEEAQEDEGKGEDDDNAQV
ncbi:RRI1 [Candida pseudojiufengensis]|uniref:RRI1 n=1 Tax=Candida pseudojiufengensis TaxID=497109 RepID=UPI00222464CC|nr:RRI1 [Candida pseudojiufengensis]KAI5965626.1 RRI1 [Candida pseudojiufengensis]